jgi:hypothetical protein
MSGYHTLTAKRPSPAAAQWDWREFYRSEPVAERRAGPAFAIATGLGGQAVVWDVDYARPMLEQIADFRRFRARFWQLALPALGLFWGGVIWAFVG